MDSTLLEKEWAQAEAIYQMVLAFFINYSFQIVGAVIILIIGILIARKVANAVLRLCERKALDITLSRFIASAVRLIVIAMVLIVALGKLGISVTPFVAAIGALSLGAGLAVQGLLSNYGAGLNIILTRPFVVGDTICVQGVAGVVKEVHLAVTIISDEDDVRITIPNKHIIGEIIHNSSTLSLAELEIGIAYSEDPQQAIAIVEEAIRSTGGYDTDKVPKVGIDSFGDSSVNLGIRVWVPTQQFYDIKFKLNQAIFLALKSHHIEIPFPQRDVRIVKQ